METTIILCGIYNLLFGVFHLFFWKFFGWKKELKNVSKVNSGIMQILNIQIIIFFFIVGFICLKYSQEILQTKLGFAFLVGNFIFWLARTVNQFIFLKINDIRVHFLTVIFILGMILFLIPIVNAI
ncbi:hypothetical protein GCM10010992_13630 [Cloacibacterium rupense]|uniref:DUF4181 domain-containing protein n=1 Tax=Cloacibacterium rupense TaxID=517423 RepID=A0ABQ2NKR6_9FLAO|nr:hypothetical protein [Cloacibacterium rupense]GGP03811.1 hypothetical protein GCM10010992_13630 [Cloacibacterium rupense]